MSTVLVTGADGFVGSHVIERGEQHGLNTVPTEGDLRRSEVVQSLILRHRPAAVVHLAEARAGSEGDAWTALAENLIMAGNLLSAVRDVVPTAPILLAGSAAQYGLASPQRLTEEAPMKPVSPYGASKCVLETAVLSEALRGKVRVIWTRSFNHLGPGQSTDAPLANWARQIADAERGIGGTVRTGRLDVERDFLDVRDVADAYLTLVRSPAEGVVNVCSGHGIRLRVLAEKLVGLSTVALAIERDLELERRVDPPAVVGDPSRLRELTGWRPAIALEDSLAEVLADWRARVTDDVLAQRV